MTFEEWWSTQDIDAREDLCSYSAHVGWKAAQSQIKAIKGIYDKYGSIELIEAKSESDYSDYKEWLEGNGQKEMVFFTDQWKITLEKRP